MSRSRAPQGAIAGAPQTAAEWACLVLGGHHFTDTTTWVSPRTRIRTGRVFCAQCGTPGFPRRTA